MPSILVVDDDPTKSAAISRAILEVPGYSFNDIMSVRDATSAKLALRTSKFDLVLLDLMLPLRDGGVPEPDGGTQLLEEFVSRPGYIRPTHVVGITAHDSAFADYLDVFAKELWALVRYSATDNLWISQVQAKARYIVTSRTAGKDFDFDLAVLTALDDPEFSEVKQLPWDWKLVDLPGDPAVYFEGRFRRRDGSTGRAVAAKAPSMGMAASAILTTKLAISFRPRKIAMVGICAGDASSVHLGDVIFASMSWDYQSGKHVLRDGEAAFEPAAQQAAITASVRRTGELAQADRAALDGIRNRYRGRKAATALDIHIGPLVDEI